MPVGTGWSLAVPALPAGILAMATVSGVVGIVVMVPFALLFVAGSFRLLASQAWRTWRAADARLRFGDILRHRMPVRCASLVGRKSRFQPRRRRPLLNALFRHGRDHTVKFRHDPCLPIRCYLQRG